MPSNELRAAKCGLLMSHFSTLPTPLATQVIKDKDGAVRGQDFEKAGQLRDREMELKAKIQAVVAGGNRCVEQKGGRMMSATGQRRRMSGTAQQA